MKDDVPFVVHSIRATQLAKLAENWRCEPNEALDRLVSEKLVSGEIPDTTPGFEVVNLGNLVAFKIGTDRTPPLNWKQAWSVSQGLGRILSGDVTGFRAKFDGGSQLIFEITGKYLVIGFRTENYQTYDFATESILKDLARQFRNAALEAKARKAKNSQADVELLSDFEELTET